jgi:hypothetical protein
MRPLHAAYGQLVTGSRVVTDDIGIAISCAPILMISFVPELVTRSPQTVSAPNRARTLVV